MPLSRESIAGLFSIATLVATAVWYARNPESTTWPVPIFLNGEPSPGLPEISVGELHWSADGRRLLVRTRSIGQHDDTLTLHCLAPTGRSLPLDTAGRGFSGCALASDGCHALVGAWSGELWWIDAESSAATLLAELPDRRCFTAVAIQEKEGCRLAAGGTSDGRILLCDLHDLTVSELHSERTSVCCLSFYRNGALVACSHGDGSIEVWDLASGSLRQILPGHGQGASVVAFLEGDAQIISGALDDSVRIWDLAGNREMWRGEFGLRGVRALDVSPDGKTAAWGGFDRRVIVWDLAHQRKKFECATAARFVTTVKFSPDGTMLAAAGFEGTVRLYDAQSGAERKGLDVSDDRSDPDRSGNFGYSSPMQ
jgi:WD40 repeat protein